MSKIPEWDPAVVMPEWSTEELQLLPTLAADSSKIPLATFLKKSDEFTISFPLDVNRCKNLKNVIPEGILERNINSAYPILHENVLHLYAKYILFKQKHGNAIERDVFKNMDVIQFVDRLLTKRAAVFFGKIDNFILVSGEKGRKTWEDIGTPKEKEPFKLYKCISYEEIKLSAFLSVSSYSHFMNVGDRKNFGVYAKNRDSVQDEGIIMGLIGPRLVKKGVMEYQELVIEEEQNRKENGYGCDTENIHNLFANFYDEKNLDYIETLELMKRVPDQFTQVNEKEIFNNFAYYKRLIFTIDTLFLEANQRAKEKDSTAYVYVVGFGLGVWKKHACQNRLFMDTCAKRIEALGKQLSNISDICFGWIQHNSCGPYKHGDLFPIEGHPCKGIRIYLCKREPHEKLKRKDAGKLLVVSYAWDGNALPGNEYWTQTRLGSSGDSAAASSTQITELHNPFINPKVCASNLRIIKDNKVVTYQEYLQNLQKGDSEAGGASGNTKKRKT